MKRFLKIFFVRLLYRCEIEKLYFAEKRKETRWKFRLYPRKIPMAIFNVLLSPIVFVKSGYEGVVAAWRGFLTVQSWSSYELWSIDQPSKSECYSRF